MCGPLWPIGDNAGPGEVELGKSRDPQRSRIFLSPDDAGPGEVESGKSRDPPGSMLYQSGRGEGGGRSRIFLSP